MPITRISHNGRSWPIDEFVQACIDHDCPFPAPVAATIIRNVKAYTNRGTISGSQLHAECDFGKLLEKHLDYTEEIGDLWASSFRGSNVHAMLETTKNDPRFKHWMFEERFFAVIWPDDRIERLDVPLLPDGEEKDWKAFDRTCEGIRQQGGIIFSGGLDAYEPGIIRDWKTRGKLANNPKAKVGWQQQMNGYALLLRVHDLDVHDVLITVMDSADVTTVPVFLQDFDLWVPMFFLPRVRELEKQRRFTKQQVLDVLANRVDVPEGFPLPVINYLCTGENKTGKMFCPVRESCPAWLAMRGVVASPAS